MNQGTFVKLRESSCYYNAVTPDRHNPIDKIGIVVEIGNVNQNETRTAALPVVVNWGELTNSYKYMDLDILT